MTGHPLSLSGLRGWLQRWCHHHLPHIPDALWQHTLAAHPFLQRLDGPQQQQLRQLCQHFLHRKQFTGAHGFAVSDAMALAVAAQACVLLLQWGPPQQALRWYDDFVGIIIYPADALAQRSVVDHAGVVHHYTETLMGEAMERGPVVISAWSLQAGGHPLLGPGNNVVIHEFAHKLDMAHGEADGCPPLPTGFMGCRRAADARQLWASVWREVYADFVDAVAAHARFGQPAPWLDAYAAESPAEFFAVACEAYWTAPDDFSQHFPALRPLMDALFIPSTAT